MLKRILTFGYGLAAYLVFLGTFLYAIAFVGGFSGVPHTLDGPLTGAIGPALAVNVLLLGVFAIQHSVMARRWFKARWTKIISPAIERSTYVLAASLALLLVITHWRPIGIEVWSVENPVGQVALWTAFALGWLTVLVTTFLINHFDLFGLRQVTFALLGEPYRPVSFVTPMPYRFVRHPLYLGFILAFWATPHMTLAHLVFAITTTVYIVLAIQFEESDLIAEHGEAYRKYRRQVPMLIPGSRSMPATPAHA